MNDIVAREFYDPEDLDEIVAWMSLRGYYPVGVIDTWSDERGDTVYKQAFKKEEER